MNTVDRTAEQHVLVYETLILVAAEKAKRTAENYFEHIADFAAGTHTAAAAVPAHMPSSIVKKRRYANAPFLEQHTPDLVARPVADHTTAANCEC